MKMKRLFLLLAFIMLMSFSVARGDMILPPSLTRIEEEAFYGNTAIQGVLSIPSGIQDVGTDAFSGTNLYALIVPSSVQTLGSQSLNQAAYVRFEGNTQSDSIYDARCIIAPSDSPAMIAAQSTGMRCIALSDLVEADGFYFEKSSSGLQLLCAVDDASIGDVVTIPYEVQDNAVKSVSSFAFVGCSQLRQISLPNTLKGRIPTSVFANCPEAEVTYYTTDGLTAIDVKASVEHCTPGSHIMWHVSGLDNTSGLRFEYTLTKDNEIVAQTECSEPTYDYTLKEAGVYCLSVKISDNNVITACGESAPVYCSVSTEVLPLTVPAVISAGEDLTITVGECENALNYEVFLTDDDTGTLIDSQYLNKAGEISFEGYLLETGVYRVTGYVYGNSYTGSIPTVRRFEVIGEKSTANISFEVPQSVKVGDYIHIRIEPGWAMWRTSSDSEGNELSVWKLIIDDYGYWDEFVDVDRFSEGGEISLSFAKRVDGRWTAWSPARTIQVLPTPRLDAPEIMIPDDLVPGRDAVLRFAAVENAERYRYRVTYLNNDYVILDELFVSQADEIFLPGYDLKPGDYTVSVRAEADGYQSSRTERTFTVSGEMAEPPVCATDKDTVFTDNDDVTITVSAPGAEDARVIIRTIQSSTGNTWSGRNRMIQLDEAGQGTLYESFYWDSEEIRHGWQLEVMACTVSDGIWSAWSEPIYINISTHESLPEAVIDAPATLLTGEDLSFHFNSVENASRYEVYVGSFYGDERVHSWHNNATPDVEMTVPGYELSSGRYRITVIAQGDGYTRSTAEAVFTVSGTRPIAPAVTFSVEALYVNKAATFTIDAQDAEAVCVTSKYVKGDNNHGMWTDKPIIQNGSAVWQITPFEEVIGYTCMLRFSVKRDGRWSAWQELNYVVQDLPALDSPVIHIESQYDAGQDITFSFDPVENATAYRYVFTYPGGNQREDCQPGTPIVIDGFIPEPGACSLQVIATSSEYTSGSSEAQFDIVGHKPDACNVSVSSDHVYIDDIITFIADTSNAELLYYRSYIIDNNGTWSAWINNRDYINVFDTETKWTIRPWFAGKFTYAFTALINGRWTAWSNVTINVSEADAIDTPAIDVPESIVIGEDLNIMLSSPNADSYYVSIYNSRNMQIASKNLYSGEGTVTFEGFRLQQGTLHIHVEAVSGALSSKADRTVQVNAGERPNAPSVEAETEVPTANNNFAFYIISEGVEQFVARYYKDGSPNDVHYTVFDAEEGLTTWRHRISTAGTTWHYAFAVREDGMWSDWSETHTVTISDREQLSKATLHVPQNVEAGEDVFVSFDAVEHADSYSLRLYGPDEEYRTWTAYPDVERCISGHDLIAGVYRVMVIASGAEYESSQSEAFFSVTGSRESAPEVIADVNQAYTGEKITFTIFDTLDCEEIACRYLGENGESGSTTINVLSNTTLWETSYSWKGNVSWSFAVLKNSRWSAWSYPIQVQIMDRPAMADVMISLPDTIDTGRDLIVTVGEVEGADWYDVYVYNSRGGRVTNRYLSQAGDAVIPGYVLPAGTVRIEVNAYGNNGGRSTATGITQVVQTSKPAAPVIYTPEDLTVPRNTSFFISIVTEGAEHAVVRYYRIGDPNNLNYSTFASTENTEITEWRGIVYNGGVRMAYSFAIQNDGVWSDWSEFVEIDIE